MANTLTAKEIASITNGKLIGDGNNIISRLSTDSRTLSWENETLFVAIKTPKRDGHSFIPQLINRGVKSFLITDASIVNSDEAYVSSVDFILVKLGFLTYFLTNSSTIELFDFPFCV